MTFPALELRQIHPLSDRSGFSCDLFVRSGGFIALRRLILERDQVVQFLHDIEQLDQTLHGTAILTPPYEDDVLAFEVTPTGQVIVTGHLIEMDVYTQTLQFAFETDQTCLRPLIHDLRHMLDLASTNHGQE